MNASLEIWQKKLERGIRYLSEGKMAEAERYLQQSLKLAEILSVPVIIAFSQRLLATAQMKNHKLEEAEKGFAQALKFCQQLENPKGIAEAKAGLASIAALKGEWSKSIYFYQEAINIYPSEASVLRLASLYSDLGQVCKEIKEWAKSEECFFKAEELCRKCGYKKGEAEVSLYLGEQYYVQGKLIMAMQRFSMAARIFAVISEELSLANALHYLALISLEKRNIEEALMQQYRVITLYQKCEQIKEISEGYYLLSNILQYRGLLEEAEGSIHLSLRYFYGDEFGLAVRYHSLAVLSIMQREYQQAKDYYFEALRHFELEGNGPKIGEVCEELTYLLQYESENVQESFYKYLEDRSREKNISQVEVILSLAYSLKKKGNNLAALHCGWRALEMAKENEDEIEKIREIEDLIQALSKSIRRKIKGKR